MNFFEHQDSARKKTVLLVTLLIGAVLTLIAITIAVIGLFLYFAQTHTTSVSAYQAYHTPIVEHFFNLLQSKMLLWIVSGVVSVVILGSLHKLIQLSKGGKYVAESLGGRLILPNTANTSERKILNTVEEMALASGNPVPSVYLIDDDSINAFAAGLSRRDAVIGVTQGCIELLDRDELQGVMAHEFSHIHNGDMRLNMRLIACLHGILVIGLIGSMIVRGSVGYRHNRYHSHRSRSHKSGKQVALGLAFVAIGYGGTFFGNMIKAAVSRQREFLADASAVQFTRNPLGISGALKKIGACHKGAIIDSANAAEFSHLFFGQSIQHRFNALMATHPPLADRIQRIEPQWNGQFPTLERSIETRQSEIEIGEKSSLAASSSYATSSHFSTAVDRRVHSETLDESIAFDDSVINYIGESNAQTLHNTNNLLAHLPSKVIEAAHEPFSAQALIYTLLFSKKTNERQAQMDYLNAQLSPTLFGEVKLLAKITQQLTCEYRLPVIELSMPALKLLSKPQANAYITHLAGLIKADKKIELFEWCLYRITRYNLLEKKYKENRSLQQCSQSIAVLLSAIVYMGNNTSPSRAFNEGKKILQLPKLSLLGGYSLKAMDKSLDELSQLKPLKKSILLRAIQTCIKADKKVTIAEAELFRAIADTIDCPVPPLYATPSTGS
ncbi:M48 family metallopeptidase [Eionea flava]